MDKEEKAKYDRERYAKKREEIRAKANAYMQTEEYKKAKSEYDKAYKARNYEKIRERQRRWESENKERCLASNAIYRDKTREIIAERGRRYSKSVSKETYSRYRKEFIERRKSAPGSHTSKDFQDIVLDQAGICNMCYEEAFLHKDHIVPIIRMGSDSKENLQGLCGRCNARKAHRLMEEMEEQEILKKKIRSRRPIKAPRT
jgi:5-methylcytosine-specific restriction endonuclease McrA